MKVDCDRRALAAAVKTVATALPRTAALPVLQRIRVDAHDGVVVLTATDLTVGRLVEIEANVQEPGSVLADRRLAAVLASATAGTVEMSLATQLTVKSGSAIWRLEVGNLEDWPQEKMIDGDPIKVAAEWERLRVLAGITAVKDQRLSCVYLSDGQAAATDRYRLAWCDFIEGAHPELLIPAPAILSLADTPDTLVANERSVRASTADWQWWARLVDGSFPQWRKLSEVGEPAAKATIETAAWLDALKRARLIAEDHTPVSITATDSGLHLAVSRQDNGAFEEDLPATVDGEWTDIHLNGGYLASMLAPSARTTLGITDERHPMTVAGEWFHGLLMPVKT